MQELSLYILDITMNGVTAGAKNITLLLEESGPVLDITIHDDGCGMSEETVRKLKDPFYTTRTTRKVGMGVPIFTMAAQQTGGDVSITSVQEPAAGHGTTVKAEFHTDSIDCVPLGDIITTVVTLIQGSPDIDFHFLHRTQNGSVELDTKELRQQLGDIPLSTPEVLRWIREYLQEQYTENGKEGTAI